MTRKKTRASAAGRASPPARQQTAGAAPALRWCAALLFAVSVLTLAAAPRPLGDAQLPFAGCDKLLHAAEYALLALLFAWALEARPRERWAGRIAVVLALVGLVALGDEGIQSRTPGRDSDPWDLVADLCGASLALAAWRSRRAAAGSGARRQRAQGR